MYEGAERNTRTAEHLRDHTLPYLQSLDGMNQGVLRIIASVSELLVISASRGIADGSTTEEMQEEEDELIDEGFKVFDAAFRRFSLLSFIEYSSTDSGETERKQIMAAFAALNDKANELIAAAHRSFDPERIGELKEQFEEHEDTALDIIATVLRQERLKAQAQIVESAHEINRIEKATLTAGALSLIMLVGYAAFAIWLLQREGRARKDAVAANLSKSEFLATMSHEIRTPMTGVMGFADLLLDDATLSPDNRSKVGRIKTATEALLRIINDILDISKLDAGKMQIETIDFHLPSLMRDIVSLFEGSGDKSNHFGLRLRDDFPEGVKADPTRIRQVLLNLVGNAAKFTDNGHVEIIGNKFRTADDRDFLRIAIQDTGIGMTEETLSRLFIEFSQADASISREFEGTGLGLAISKRLVELMGGEIGVDSKIGEGSTFWFTLPYVAPTSEVAAHSPHSGIFATQIETLRPIKILVAEDNRVNQMIVSQTLEIFGHQFEIVENGEEAVKAHTARDVDLILMDVRMPKMSGTDATRMIRQMPGEKRTVPIVALTADAMAEHKKQYIEAGMNDVATKPIDRTALALAINNAMGEDIHSIVEVEAPLVSATEEEPSQPEPESEDVSAFLDQLNAMASDEPKS